MTALPLTATPRQNMSESPLAGGLVELSQERKRRSAGRSRGSAGEACGEEGHHVGQRGVGDGAVGRGGVLPERHSRAALARGRDIGLGRVGTTSVSAPPWATNTGSPDGGAPGVFAASSVDHGGVAPVVG